MSDAPGLLYNMSMQPRTEVRWELLPVGEVVVAFDLWRSGVPSGRARAAAVRALAADVERAWPTYGLDGAALLFHAPDPGGARPPVLRLEGRPAIRSGFATDPLLVLNVLGRARGLLLMAQASLCLGAAFVNRTLATDDPRLVELARSTGLVMEEGQ